MTNTLSFSCSLCLFSYTSQIYLQKHIKTRHHEEYVRMVKSGEINFEDLLNPEAYSSRPQEWEIYNCSKFRKNFSQHSYFKTHRCFQSVKLHHCSQCNKTFTKQADLKSHQRTPIRQNLYECSECGKNLKQKAYFQEHQRIHRGEILYCCSKCGKSFFGLNDLQQHQCIHTREKLYHCSQCNTTFTRQSNLKHTGAVIPEITHATAQSVERSL